MPKEFNYHVFLLDADLTIIKKMYYKAIIPIPYYGFCDQKGRISVAVYGLKTKPDVLIFSFKKSM